MIETNFLRAEENYLTPPEYENNLVCECCDREILEGDVYFENDFHLLCESCAVDKLYGAMQTA